MKTTSNTVIIQPLTSEAGLVDEFSYMTAPYTKILFFIAWILIVNFFYFANPINVAGEP